MTILSTRLHQNTLWVLCCCFSLFWGIGTTIAQEQPTRDTAVNTSTITQAPPKQSQEPPLVPIIVQVLTPEAGIGDELHLVIDSISAYAIEHNRFAYRDLELFLDGMRFHSLNPHFISPNILSFPLVYDDSSRHEWRNLLGTLESASHTTRVGIGLEGEPESIPLQTTSVKKRTFTFEVYREGWLIASLLFILTALAAFWFMAVRSNILRDTMPVTPADNGKRPYSLARFQMALWFFIILSSYIFIFLLTGQYNNVLNEQALILIGIGTGTALGAALIDANKNSAITQQLDTLLPQKSKAEAERASLVAQLQAMQAQGTATPQQAPAIPDVPPAPNSPVAPTSQTLRGQIAEKDVQIATLQTRITQIQDTQNYPVSQGFFIDILTDQTGVSFSRFQILMWTIVLVVIFCAEVYQNLLMPTFNTTLLALMGISSSTYLGFKIPEQQAPPPSVPPTAAQ